MSSNVEQRPKIESVQGNIFIFHDGSSAEVDSFIYCTGNDFIYLEYLIKFDFHYIHDNKFSSGYKFTYPFMSTKVEIRTDDNHVEPIYKHLMHMDYMNLFFMGLPAIVIPFPMFHIQAQYILGILEGRIQLLSPQRMREEYEIEKKSLLDQGIQVILAINFSIKQEICNLKDNDRK